MEVILFGHQDKQSDQTLDEVRQNLVETKSRYEEIKTKSRNWIVQIKRLFKEVNKKPIINNINLLFLSFIVILISVAVMYLFQIVILIGAVLILMRQIKVFLISKFSFFYKKRFFCSEVKQRYNKEYLKWQTDSSFLTGYTNNQNTNMDILNNYNSNFWDILNQYEKRSLTSKKIKSEILKHSKIFLEDKQENKSTQESILIRQQQLIYLVSLVSSYWTIFNYESKKSQICFLKPIQIISILYMLGVHTEIKFEYENHLIDLDIIEDKSIIICITSIILHILEFEVYVCHYNQHISKTSYNEFKQFFESLEIVNNIKYSTLNQIYEDVLISNNHIKIFIKQSSSNIDIKNSVPNIKKVLIFNDVDYLFEGQFIGQPFNLEEKFSSDYITSLFQIIWKRRNENLQLKDIKLTKEYQSLFDINKDLIRIQEVIDFQINQMIKDSVNLAQYHYENDTKSNKINISFLKDGGSKINNFKGYKTQFAILDLQDQLLNQNTPTKINWQSVLMDQLYLKINIGIFSYEHLPSHFKLVLGVNTNLLNFSDQQTKKTHIIQFKNITNMSSQNNLTQTLTNEIKNSKIFMTSQEQLSEIYQFVTQEEKQNHNTFIFFKDSKQLNCFNDLAQQNQNTININIINNENFKQNDFIKSIVQKNTIVLSTHELIRDVELIIRKKCNQNITKIIQTYIPNLISDFIFSRRFSSANYDLIISKEQEDKEYKEVTHHLWKDFISNKNTQKNDSGYVQNFIVNVTKSYSQFEENELKKKSSLIMKNHNLTMKFHSQLNHDDQIKENSIKELLNLQKKCREVQVDNKKQYEIYGKHISDYSNIEIDQFKNPKLENIELGRNGVFGEFNLIIGDFYGFQSQIHFEKDIIPILKKKGIKEYLITTNEIEFIQKLHNYDQAWIISGQKFHSNLEINTFVDAVLEFHYKGKGLILWSDDCNLYYHQNLILKKLSFGEENGKNIQIQMQECYYGDKIIQRTQDNLKYGTFKDHPITTGISNLYEGNTISFPVVVSNTSLNNFGDIQIIGMNTNSSDSKPVLAVYEGDGERGRIIFDCGYTKLWNSFFYKTAGTSTYVSNIYVYSFNLEKFQTS